jgi:predicted NAD/FAD-dependent oxidoreductase
MIEERETRAEEGRGLFCSGDGFTRGRVHLALEHGMATGDRVADSFGA